MDITNLGIDVALVAAIITATKALTKLADPQAVLERFYPLLPVAVAVPFCVLRFWGQPWWNIALQVLIFGFIAGHTYKTGKTTVFGDGV